MHLWSLLLPFKWFIIGVGEVLSGIFYLLKKVTFFIGSLFKYLFEGIIVISRVIVLLLKNIFKYLIIVIKWVILKLSFLFMLLFKVLKRLFIFLYKILSFIIVNVVKGLAIGIKYFFTYLYKILSFIIINAAKGLFITIKGLIIGLKYFFIYAYKTLYFIIKNTIKGFVLLIEGIYKSLKFIFTYLYLFFKTVFTYLYLFFKTIFKYLYLFFKLIFTYLFKALKWIYDTILVKYLGSFFRGVYNVIVIILRFIARIPSYIWRGIKWFGRLLYKTFITPILFVAKNTIPFIKRILNIVKNKIKRFSLIISGFFKKIIKSISDWFNNLSFIKDLKNRKDLQRQVLLIDFDAEDAARSEKKVLYRYVAKNADGKIEKGFLGAFSKLDVHSYLLAEGYEVYEIVPTKSFSGGNNRTHKIKVSELVFFLTQLSTYIKSGIPLVDSIKILGKQSRKGGSQTVYKGIIYDLTMGDSFSEALEKQGNSFPRLLVNMVKASELAGNLSETLDDMADYYDSVSQTRKQMKSAMTYPTVISVFALGVVVFILTFVIPSFVKMYKDADAEVPAITTAIINLSDFLSNNFVWLILGVVGVIAGVYFMYKNVKMFRLLVQWGLMHAPIIGNIIIYNEVTMFAKTFASLWNHNVFITSSMEILSKITNNEIYKMLIFDAITNVARGDPVSASFKKHWAFPIVAYEMLLTGERTGQPGPMMEKVAQYYQEEHKNAVNQVKAFIEPALIIFLAVVVGVILLSVVLPMFSIYGQLGLGSGQ